MYLAYIDDSEFTAKKDQQKSAKQAKQQQEEQFQVLCSVLVHDRLFAALEMRFTIYALLGYGLPEDFPPDFEFHADELFDGTGFFENWDQPKRFHIFQQCMETVAQLQLPVLYGAVDKAKLAKQIYKSANPLDMAFRLCVERVTQWLKANNPWEIGLLISDNFDEGKKRNIKRVFREYRKKFSAEAREVMERVHSTGAPGAQTPEQIPTSNLLDDMYFGDSRDSVGIQAADMCAFLIRRHLAGKQESEWLFKIIEPRISGRVWPE